MNTIDQDALTEPITFILRDRDAKFTAVFDEVFRFLGSSDGYLPTVNTGHPAPHLGVTDIPTARDIGLAWAAGRNLPPLSEAFRRHVLASASLTLPVGYAR